jgi:hypothetical protein
MRFLILGIDHNWQLSQIAPVPAVGNSRETAERRARLESLVLELIGRRRVDCICEECNPCYVTVAQKMAFESVPRIYWQNIVMTSQERLEAGIYEDSLDRPSRDEEKPPGSGRFQTIHSRIPADDVREQFFATKSIGAASEVKAESILILVGHMHADSLGHLLTEQGFEVEVNTELITEKTWE